jgi:thioredoxin 1
MGIANRGGDPENFLNPARTRISTQQNKNMKPTSQQIIFGKRAYPLAAVLSLFLVFNSSNAQEAKSGIEFFNGTWKEAVAKAKQEHKCIFFDAYASWCGPCKAMDREVFVVPAVADYVNTRFVAVRVDMEKGEGPELAKKLTSINGYPSLLFFDAEGHLAKTLLGDRTAEEFLQEAKLVAK